MKFYQHPNTSKPQCNKAHVTAWQVTSTCGGNAALVDLFIYLITWNELYNLGFQTYRKLYYSMELKS